MAFLFKSKKGQERVVSSRDGNSGSQGSIQTSAGKNSSQARATPTESLNSIDTEGASGAVQSPEKPVHRRGTSSDQAQPSDLPVGTAEEARYRD